MVTDHGLAVEHTEWLLEFREWRSQHDVPVSVGDIAGFAIHDFTILSSEYGGSWDWIGTLTLCDKVGFR